MKKPYVERTRKRRRRLDKKPGLKQPIREWLIAKCGGKAICAFCGCELADEDITLDHIIPFSKDGKDEPENMALACKSCNVQKADEDWMELKFRDLVEPKYGPRHSYWKRKANRRLKPRGYREPEKPKGMMSLGEVWPE